MKRKQIVRHRRRRSYTFLFDEALGLVRQFAGRVIVELGSIRNTAWKKTDGHSTLKWAASGLNVWSVDIDAKATQLTMKILGDAYPCVTCVNDDGIRFLAEFPHKIDLLYLDGPDPDKGNGRAWAADAFDVAMPKLADSAVLLIDDTDLPRRGKGELAIPRAEAAGFKLMSVDRQALLVRGLNDTKLKEHVG